MDPTRRSEPGSRTAVADVHHRDRDQFLQLTVRLRGVADKRGDSAFASALGQCLVDASGGEPNCPMADLLIGQYAEAGHMPDLGTPPKAPPLPLNAADPPPYDRQRLLNFIHHALEERAVLRGDTHFVEALHGCQRAMLDNDGCPIHRFLRQQQTS